MKFQLLSLAACALISGFASNASAAQCLNTDTIRQVLAPVYEQKGGYMAAAWEDVDNIPQLRRCGLALGPNDLRKVRTFAEFIGVVHWGLNKAGVCRPCK